MFFTDSRKTVLDFTLITSVMGFYVIESSTKLKFKAKSEKSTVLACIFHSTRDRVEIGEIQVEKIGVSAN